jgi:hypothetical protein
LIPGSVYSIELMNLKPAFVEVFYLNSLDIAKEYLTSKKFKVLKE